MRKFIIKTFVKDYENTKDPHVRNSYGKLAGIAGIVTNILLCTAKIAVGLMYGSIAIIADGVNNLADASSSIILLIGVRMASKPADKAHPYGHARIEYITGLLISFIIIIIGIQLMISSIDKIRHPSPVTFSYISLIILILAIAVKVWQALFNLYIGEIINSTAIKATGADSRNDVISTSAVLISVLIGMISGYQLDGIMGALVALFIVYSGIRLIMEASTPLLGGAPDPEMIREIHDRIMSHEKVIGIHDLVVHNYGPGRTFASVHIEVDSKEDVIASHDMIDNIERSISRDMNIELVAHMDPLDTDDPLIDEIGEELNQIISEIPGIIEYHDLRIVKGYTHHNIIFDIVVGHECSMKEQEIKKLLSDRITKLSSSYFPVITIDKSYTNTSSVS